MQAYKFDTREDMDAVIEWAEGNGVKVTWDRVQKYVYIPDADVDAYEDYNTWAFPIT